MGRFFFSRIIGTVFAYKRRAAWKR